MCALVTLFYGGLAGRCLQETQMQLEKSTDFGGWVCIPSRAAGCGGCSLQSCPSTSDLPAPQPSPRPGRAQCQAFSRFGASRDPRTPLPPKGLPGELPQWTDRQTEAVGGVSPREWSETNLSIGQSSLRATRPGPSRAAGQGAGTLGTLAGRPRRVGTCRVSHCQCTTACAIHGCERDTVKYFFKLVFRVF